MALDIKCTNFLADNPHVYARKAARKKLAILRVEATNGSPADFVITWASAQLLAGGKRYAVENPDAVIRKLGEFTWDFLLYSILDFHPITAALDATLFLTGPLYNRRLRRQLALLTGGQANLAPGDSASVLIAFRGAAPPFERLTLVARNADGREEPLECGVQ